MTKYGFELYLVNDKSIGGFCHIFVASSGYINSKNSSHYFVSNFLGYYLAYSWRVQT